MVYNITNSEINNRSVVTVFDDDGSIHTFSNESPIFTDLIFALTAGDFDEARELMTSGTRVRDEFLSLSENLTIRGNSVYYSDEYHEEELYGRLAEHILDLSSRNVNLDRLVNFVERIMMNPSYNSRQQLYEFLDRYDFVITEDGKFIAYKGVNADYTSIHAGYGVVDGVEYNGHLPNNVGSVLTIPRNMVDDNVNNGCSFGLHVGTWDYANGFGRGATLTVEVDPADVVSVPHDVSHQKIRVTRYKVIDRAEQEIDFDDWYNDDLDNWDLDDGPTDEELYEQAYDEVVYRLKQNASWYTTKGKIGSSYRAITERMSLDEFLDPFMLEQVIQDLDQQHTANAVYRYHIERL